MLTKFLLLLFCAIISEVIGEQCPEGWFTYQDSCYFIEKAERKNFHQARFSCEAVGAHLFVPNSFDEWEVVKSHVSDNTFTWIGLWDNDQTLVYDPQWDTYGGMNIDNLPWLIRGPGHGHSARAHCIWYFHNKSTDFVNYAPCVATRHEYICEYNSSDILVPRGRDSRLLPNKAPYYQLIKDRPVANSLDNLAGNQVSRYSQAGSGGQCPEGQLSYLSSCIYVERSILLSFADAQKACQDIGATLWVPNNAEEWATVRSYLDPYRQYWIGLADNGLTPEFDPVWQNLNGMDMNQLPWQLPLLPNKGHVVTQDCVRMLTNPLIGDLVHWTACIIPLNYICEVDKEYPIGAPVNEVPIPVQQEQSQYNQYGDNVGGPPVLDDHNFQRNNEVSRNEPYRAEEYVTEARGRDSYNGDEPVASCPPEWFAFRDSCYYIERSQSRSYTDAQDFCTRLDSTLFVPDSDNEWKYVTSRAETFRSTWVGLTGGGGYNAAGALSSLGGLGNLANLPSLGGINLDSLGSLGGLGNLAGLGAGFNQAGQSNLAGNLQSSNGLGSLLGGAGLPSFGSLGSGRSGSGGLGGLRSGGLGSGGLGGLGGSGGAGLPLGSSGGGYGSIYAAPVTQWETNGGINPARLPWFVQYVPNNGYISGFDCVSYMKTLIGEGVQWAPCNIWQQFVCEYNATAVPVRSDIGQVDSY